MESLNTTLLPIVQTINGYLADYVLVFLLVGAGLFFIFLGTIFGADLVWELTDLANYLMVIPNVIGLIACSGLVVTMIPEKK